MCCVRNLPGESLKKKCALSEVWCCSEEIFLFVSVRIVRSIDKIGLVVSQRIEETTLSEGLSEGTVERTYCHLWIMAYLKRRSVAGAIGGAIGKTFATNGKAQFRKLGLAWNEILDATQRRHGPTCLTWKPPGSRY